MSERYDTVVIGGGQAGLAMSYYFRDRGREHIILERSRVAERWHSERWNSLTFQFPNWALRLPAFAYAGDAPDAFAPNREIIRYVEDYARFIEAPLRCNTAVTRLRQNEDGCGFIVETGDGAILASHVVVATGPFQRPSVPAFAAAFPADILQVHASGYRDPNQLPPGAVLVVGSGASGCQIAEELLQAGRTVYLSISRHRRAPRRYRGRDVTWWFLTMGIMDTRIDSFPGRKIPPSTVITGVNGGYDINVRQFAADGMIVLGRLTDIADGIVYFDDSVDVVLAAADQTFADFKAAADRYVQAGNLDIPAADGANAPSEPVALKPVSQVNLKHAGIGSVVWSTGYRFNYGWIQIPVFNDSGAPTQERGVTECRNLFFIGLHWMHTFKSGLIFGVGDDAAYLADQIDAQA